MNSNKFWIVVASPLEVSPGSVLSSGKPMVHKTYMSALKESQRLAEMPNNTGRGFFVMESVSVAYVESPKATTITL
jgi:hypothetical protein